MSAGQKILPRRRSSGKTDGRDSASAAFSLIGILAKISGILAENGISIFALSTYNTDYVLVKAENFEKALQALSAEGFTIV